VEEFEVDSSGEESGNSRSDVSFDCKKEAVLYWRKGQERTEKSNAEHEQKIFFSQSRF